MTRPAPLKQVATDSEVEVARDTAEPLSHPSEDEAADNPANELLAKLTLALAADHASATILAADTGRDPGRWPLSKMLGVLCLGCGAFWLLVIVAIAGRL